MSPFRHPCAVKHTTLHKPHRKETGYITAKALLCLHDGVLNTKYGQFSRRGIYLRHPSSHVALTNAFSEASVHDGDRSHQNLAAPAWWSTGPPRRTRKSYYTEHQAARAANPPSLGAQRTENRRDPGDGHVVMA